MKQLTLAAVGFERCAKTTRRAAFLTEMERVVPRPALFALVEPFYPKPGNASVNAIVAAQDERMWTGKECVINGGIHLVVREESCER